MAKYKVVRQHYGDKQYFEGDEREVKQVDADQLIEMGLIEDIKKQEAPSNKKIKRYEDK